MNWTPLDRLAARFHENYIPVPESGCWLWTAGLSQGYGQLRIGGEGRKSYPARTHRLSWELHRGPIPPGMHVCHKCDTPSCVNPDHLFIGTSGDNARDKAAKGRAQPGKIFPPGERHPRAVLTDALVRSIRERVASGQTQRAVAKALGLNPYTVNNVVKGRTWRHA